MKWFDTTFLPSLFEKAGVGKSLWLSQKQTAVCVKYMEQHTVCFGDEVGNICRHLNYTCTWQDRDVILSYSKLNGCGTIYFGLNPAEKLESEKAAEKAEWEREYDLISRQYRKRREKFDKEYKDCLQRMQEIEEYIAEDRETNDTELLEKDLEAQKRHQRYLDLYERVIRENS